MPVCDLPWPLTLPWEVLAREVRQRIDLQRAIRAQEQSIGLLLVGKRKACQETVGKAA